MNPQAPSPFASLIPVVVIFAIFYFLLIRPQQKQQQDHEKMLAALKKGDRIVTTGGLIGVITQLKGPELEVKIAENVRVMIARSAVARMAPEAAETTQPS